MNNKNYKKSSNSYIRGNHWQLVYKIRFSKMFCKTHKEMPMPEFSFNKLQPEKLLKIYKKAPVEESHF